MQEYKKTIYISEKEEKNQRIDKFLAYSCTEKSRSYWQKRIKNGEILVNGKIVKQNYILKEGDRVDILPEKEQDDLKKAEAPEVKIIYEDTDVIVLDKPARLLSHSAVSNKSPSVADFLLNYFPKIENVGEDSLRPGIVHRLDKDTSGVMIAAKNNKSFFFLKNQFKNREAQKIYTALVYGNVEQRSGFIDLRIGRSKTKPYMQTVVDTKEKLDVKSREALTLYKIIKTFSDYTLLKVFPKTGRMHQIRVHLKAIGHPIVGDKKYFFRKRVRIGPPLARQFLHASELRIKLPSGKKRAFKSELPQDLKEFLDKIAT